MLPHSPHILLVESGTTNGVELAGQLARAGLQVDLVTSPEDAQGALRTIYYQSCVVTAGVADPDSLKLIAGLRRCASHVWMIVLCDGHESVDERSITHARRLGADAIIPAPYSVHDLASRLVAFSLRSRPAF